MRSTLEPNKLFKQDDATDEAFNYYVGVGGQPSVKSEIDGLIDYLQGEHEADDLIRKGCKTGTGSCDMWSVCGAHLPSPGLL